MLATNTAVSPTDLRFQDVIDRPAKRARDVVNALKIVAFDQARFIAIEQNANPGEILRQTISKPHVRAITLFPRSEWMATETGDGDETVAIRTVSFEITRRLSLDRTFSHIRWVFRDGVQWRNALKVGVNPDIGPWWRQIPMRRFRISGDQIRDLLEGDSRYQGFLVGRRIRGKRVDLKAAIRVQLGAQEIDGNGYVLGRLRNTTDSEGVYLRSGEGVLHVKDMRARTSK